MVTHGPYDGGVSAKVVGRKTRMTKQTWKALIPGIHVNSDIEDDDGSDKQQKSDSEPETLIYLVKFLMVFVFLFFDYLTAHATDPKQ